MGEEWASWTLTLGWAVQVKMILRRRRKGEKHCFISILLHSSFTLTLILTRIYLYSPLLHSSGTPILIVTLTLSLTLTLTLTLTLPLALIATLHLHSSPHSPQGIWTGTMDGSDVNAADRSPSGKLLATGDDFGKVRFRCFIS